jgi:hypothetical protein
MVNDQTGKSGFDWSQNVMIQVNSSSKQVAYNPHFYAYKHFGYYVKAGAKAVKYSITGSGPAKTNAFRNPNGDIILVCSNTNSSAFALTAKVGSMMYKASLPANSFNTLRILSSTSVRETELKKAGVSVLSKARICNSMLYFTLSAAANAQELNVTLTDLEGRTIWTGRRGGDALHGEQVFKVRPIQGGLCNGNYLLTVRIKNRDGEISIVENTVSVIKAERH